MPNGADPHEYQPSAKDVEALGRADLVVENGLKLEEGLEDALAQARDDGVRIFTATDHVTLRPFGADDAQEIAEHGPDDPHIWTSPIAMREMVTALAPALASELDIDVAARASDLEERLTALDAQITETLAPIPADRRKLVTGHESLGLLRAALQLRPDRGAHPLAELAGPGERGQPRHPAPAGRGRGRAGHLQRGRDARGGGDGHRRPDRRPRRRDRDPQRCPDDGSYFTFMRDMAAAVSRGLDPPPAG